MNTRTAFRASLGRTTPGAGFTLLELLIVITILAVLASVIIVSIRHAQSAAKRNMTEGNLKLLMSALARYETDFDDFPPSLGDATKGAASLYECLMTEKKNGQYVKPGDIKSIELENGVTVFADGWNRPIYYLHHRDYGNRPPNKRDFRLMSAGADGRMEEGEKGSDDVVNWNKDKPE